MANETTTTINFKLDIDHSLPHPEESCLVTFLGKAVITQEIEDEKLWQGVEITELWMGIDVPSHPIGIHFRKVKHTNLGKLSGELEMAALDALESPQAVTLPSETNPLEIVNLAVHPMFTKSKSHSHNDQQPATSNQQPATS